MGMIRGRTVSGGKLEFYDETTGTIVLDLDAQSAAITNASTAHALSATYTDTEVEATLNALGTKLNSALTALRAYGIIAP